MKQVGQYIKNLSKVGQLLQDADPARYLELVPHGNSTEVYLNNVKAGMIIYESDSDHFYQMLDIMEADI